MGDERDNDYTPVVLQAYEEEAEFELDDDHQITNHDELVNEGMVFREVRLLDRESVERHGMTEITPDHRLWCDAVANLDLDDGLRVANLPMTQ